MLYLVQHGDRQYLMTADNVLGDSRAADQGLLLALAANALRVPREGITVRPLEPSHHGRLDIGSTAQLYQLQLQVGADWT